jgi:hypothetical protein
MNLFSRRFRNLILFWGPVLFLAGILYLQEQPVSPASSPAAIPTASAD